MRRPDFDIADVLFGIFIVLMLAIMMCGCDAPKTECTGPECPVGQHKPEPDVKAIQIKINDYYPIYRTIDREMNNVCYISYDGRMSCVKLSDKCSLHEDVELKFQPKTK